VCWSICVSACGLCVPPHPTCLFVCVCLSLSVDLFWRHRNKFTSFSFFLVFCVTFLFSAHSSLSLSHSLSLSQSLSLSLILSLSISLSLSLSLSHSHTVSLSHSLSVFLPLSVSVPVSRIFFFLPLSVSVPVSRQSNNISHLLCSSQGAAWRRRVRLPWTHPLICIGCGVVQQQHVFRVRSMHIVAPPIFRRSL
jgi:hypothetical protein